MTRFKEFSQGLFHSVLEFPSVSVSLKDSKHTLHLRFNNLDIITAASYAGPLDLWLGSLCFLIQGKSLAELLQFQQSNWDHAFQTDQRFGT